MQTLPATPEAAARAATALNRVRELLQTAHFAARDFESQMPPRRFVQAELLTDCIHRARQSAEGLAMKIASIEGEGR